jgi:hypothetical protein
MGRRRRLTRDQKLVLSAVAAGLLLAAGHGPAAAGHAGNTLTAKVVPGGSSYTPASWAAAFLAGGGWPQTSCNLAAIQAWEAAEGGNWNNSAQYNPLNTTQQEPGSRPVNSAGVQAFPSWQEGFQANLTVINNGLYGGILAALRAGDNAQAVADAVAASPWGTAPFQASC